MRAPWAASVLLALISAVAFATILAVVAGLTLTSASSVAHDLYANVIKKGQATEKQRAGRGPDRRVRHRGGGHPLAIPAQRLNIAFLVALAFAVAASANLPALLFNLFWRRFNTVGATFSIYGGLICAVLLVSSRRSFRAHRPRWPPTPTSPGSRSTTPAWCRSPSASSAASIGTLISKDDPSQLRYNELEVRSLTGAGAEKAVSH